MNKHGFFIKVFAYTIVSILLLVSATAVLFSQQFVSFYHTIQSRQVMMSYQPLARRIQRNGNRDIADVAQRFYEQNQSFEFYVADKDDQPIYATPNANTSSDFRGDFFFVVHRDDDFSIIAQSKAGIESLYRDLLIRAMAVFAVVLALSLVCAFVFARRITKPIQYLVTSASKMANLEEVPPLAERKDELGVLAHDIYSMYEKLKETISQLEDEILRVREMEETQRYFFSAASHELKTPIAATSVLLEGMIENIGDYKDHPKYLRECVKMMEAQDKTISEILEIVRLDSGKITPVPEKLDLGHMIENMLPDYETIAEANGLHLVLDIPGGQQCFTDPAMLARALSNVLLNALQNTPREGEIRIWSESAFAHYRLCVLNASASMDDATLPKVFDPFYRENKARSRKSGRSGLGLSIVGKTLETLDIPFALENARDGVLFWMDLPKF